MHLKCVCILKLIYWKRGHFLFLNHIIKMESALLALVLKAFMAVRAADGNFNTAWIFFVWKQICINIFIPCCISVPPSVRLLAYSDHCPSSEKDNIPIRPFPWLMRTTIIPVYMPLCTHSDYCHVKRFVQTNFPLFLSLLCKTQLSLLLLCTPGATLSNLYITMSMNEKQGPEGVQWWRTERKVSNVPWVL